MPPLSDEYVDQYIASKWIYLKGSQHFVSESDLADTFLESGLVCNRPTLQQSSPRLHPESNRNQQL